MKRILSLALCLCLLLAGCTQGEAAAQPNGQEDSKPPVEEPNNNAPAPSPEQLAAVDIEKLALALAELPELPEEPDAQALNNAMNALDYGALGAEGYQKASEALWNEYSDKMDAYHAAVRELRGDGVDVALSNALAQYTLRTTAQLMASGTEKNVVYSPANLYLALCMLAETTGGESRAQILDLLGLSGVEQARAAANSIWRNLYRDGADGRTLLANSIWLGERFTFHEDTVDTLAKEHFASVFRAPMGEKATDDAIHSWINENTNHLLEDAANGLETSPDTLMMLISTLYFKGTWQKQFNSYDTREDTFTAADGAEQKVDFMHTNENGNYYRGEGFTVASLPFRDGMAMWFLLPDEGVALQGLLPDADNVNVCIDAPEGTVQDTAFGPIMAQEGYGDIHWGVPKFDVDSDLDLIPALQALGVTDVFDDQLADFSPLTDLDALVSAVEHAARVKVDEEGCEAAAFTAIMAEATSALVEPLPVVEMNLNRPFGFAITGVSGLPLFIGAVNTVK